MIHFDFNFFWCPSRFRTSLSSKRFLIPKYVWEGSIVEKTLSSNRVFVVKQTEQSLFNVFKIIQPSSLQTAVKC